LTPELPCALNAFVPAIGPHGITLSRVSLTFMVTSLVLVCLLQWNLDHWLCGEPSGICSATSAPTGDSWAGIGWY